MITRLQLYGNGWRLVSVLFKYDTNYLRLHRYKTINIKGHNRRNKAVTTMSNTWMLLLLRKLLSFRIFLRIRENAGSDAAMKRRGER